MVNFTYSNILSPKEMMSIIKRFLWFIRSDVELHSETCWDGKEKKIDGFVFYSKKPFSKSYQYHSVIGLENTYTILKLIQEAIRDNSKAVAIEVTGGWGREVIVIWRDSLRKAETQMLEMIKKIQGQY